MKKDSDPQTLVKPKKPLNIGVAILLGHLFVTIPFTLIVLGVAGLDFYLLTVLETALPRQLDWVSLIIFIALFLIIFLLGLRWYAYSVPRWRKLVLQIGAPEVILQKWAAVTGLVWPPKSWIFMKSLFRVKE